MIEIIKATPDDMYEVADLIIGVCYVAKKDGELIGASAGYSTISMGTSTMGN
mgnify:CR=1 FL=1